MTAVRSWLYVPGHHPERVSKALAAGADAVVVDLEDAVPAPRKDEARAAVTSLLADLPADRPQVWVRINPLSSPWGARDLAALAGTGVDGVRLPRTEDPAVVAEVADALGCPLQLLLESARGLMAARELAAAHSWVRGIGLGEADLAADLRLGGPDGLTWARGWVVAVARAAGLPSPVQSVYTNVADLEGLRSTTAQGRMQGFFGRSLVHPRQVAPVHEVYRPTAEETARAQALVNAATTAAASGEVAVLTTDGRFVDPAVIAQARLVLELAAQEHTPAPAPGNVNEENT